MDPCDFDPYSSLLGEAIDAMDGLRDLASKNGPWEADEAIDACDLDPWMVGEPSLNSCTKLDRNISGFLAVKIAGTTTSSAPLPGIQCLIRSRLLISVLMWTS